ncbi:hypothetical protein CLV30_11775 [Haloactinopolyspora alba]|uniref:Uncharacterized protein n=2 Tax=Haloactinopolyspora alba TaxID=648780 RepID=A0A2P8DRC8_9ACTN|nr:hypothetical protein CLV30_11775 [Haloactinopolyspora alba]
MTTLREAASAVAILAQGRQADDGERGLTRSDAHLLRDDTMRLATTRHQYCDHCGRVTVHDVTVYYDDPFSSDEIVYCIECAE